MRLAAAVAWTLLAIAGSVSADQRDGDVVLLPLSDREMAGAVQELEHGGASVLAILPNRGVLVEAGPREELSPRYSKVNWEAVAWRPEAALSARLQRAGAEAEAIGLVVGLTLSADWRELVSRVTASGAEVRWVESAGTVRQVGVWVPAGQLPAAREALASSAGLVWADLQPPARLSNGASVWRLQSGESEKLSVHERGVRGEGQLVAVLDTGLDVDMCFFADPAYGLPAVNDDSSVSVSPGHRKVHAVDFLWSADWPDPGPRDWDSQGHGTHVAGSVAGDDGADGLHQGSDGMAPAARLIIQDGGFRTDNCGDLPGLGCPVRPLGPVLQQAWDQGARVHSNSWGEAEEAVFEDRNEYSERTADIDRFVWEHPEMVVVAAAGNDGRRDAVLSPSVGKNVLAVGAARHGDAEPGCVVSWSSRGWTDDGRIKPDVVAPGSQVLSAANDGTIATANCQVAPSSGTSMACPAVAGLAALVRQYFVDGYWPSGRARPEDGFEPTSALVRAVLIASAQDLAGPGCAIEPIPSRDQGWGMVQLDTALQLTGDRERLLVVDGDRDFASTQDDPYVLELDRAAGALKVVLVWTDPPSSSLADQHLINDLDLTVTGPSGTWLGNQLAGGRSVTGGEPDRVNPVEVVWLPEAPAGRWTIQAAPHLLRQGAQGFALVVVDTPAPREPRRGAGRADGSAGLTAHGQSTSGRPEAPARP